MHLIRVVLISFIFLLSIENEAQIVVNGDFSESAYQLLASRLNFHGGFAPDCELTNVYYCIQNDNFYLGVECKIQSVPNYYNPLPDGLGIFLNVSSRSGFPAGSVLELYDVIDYHFLNGGIEVGAPLYTLEFRADFEVDFMFAVYTDATPNNIFFDGASLSGTFQGTLQNIGTTNQSGSSALGPAVNGIFNQNSVEFAFQQSPYEGSLKGFELRIPFSELSATSSDEFELFSVIVASTAYFSDQAIPGNVLTGNSGWAPDYLNNVNNPNCSCPNPGATIGVGPYHTLPLGLPVELKTFSATTDGRNIILNWSTATELNNLGFEIQRKIGTNDFVTVGFVSGKGTTSEPNDYTFTDRGLDNGKYYYRLKQTDFNGSYQYSDIVEIEFRAFDSFILEQNYPNPFNPATTVGYGLSERTQVRLSVLNTIGEEVAMLVNEVKDAGYYVTKFNASDLPSGIYFYKLQAGNPSTSSGQVYVEMKKMVLMK